jgi:predicted AAA+ superfamily ATPase
MVDRDIEPRLRMLARQFPAIVLTGPRQSGKSTVCKKVFAHLPYATLESPEVRAFSLEDRRSFRRLKTRRRTRWPGAYTGRE